MEDKIYSEYCAILAEELQPAMGCTEPIAVAYCAALARKTLGCLPEDVQVYASANIIKNVKSVVVPNTGGQRGLTVAAAAGIVAGDADAKLQVLAGITPEQVEQIAGYEKRGIVHVHPSEKDYIFDIQVRVKSVPSPSVDRGIQVSELLRIHQTELPVLKKKTHCVNPAMLCGTIDPAMRLLLQICSYA